MNISGMGTRDGKPKMYICLGNCKLFSISGVYKYINKTKHLFIERSTKAHEFG